VKGEEKEKRERAKEYTRTSFWLSCGGEGEGEGEKYRNVVVVEEAK